MMESLFILAMVSSNAVIWLLVGILNLKYAKIMFIGWLMSVCMVMTTLFSVDSSGLAIPRMDGLNITIAAP